MLYGVECWLTKRRHVQQLRCAYYDGFVAAQEEIWSGTMTYVRD
jgi:hypothetical protein